MKPEQAPTGWWARLRRPRLTLGVLVGLAVYALLYFATATGARMRFIAAWDIGVTFTLVALYYALHRSTADEMKRVAARQDAGKWVVLILTLIAAVAGMIVIAAEMPLVKTDTGIAQPARVVLMIFTIAVSWAFIHTMFALHYAFDYYSSADAVAGKPMARSQRLIFPGDRTPTYGDFLYFSFTIGMTFQVSDTQVADAGLRRLVLLHGIASFFYTTGLLAVMINLVAGLI